MIFGRDRQRLYCLLEPNDELFAKIAAMGHGAAEGREPHEDEKHLASADPAPSHHTVARLAVLRAR
jgi:hypothetical protein